MALEDLFFSNLAENSSPKFYWRADYFFRLLFNRLSLYGFATHTLWQQSPFYAKSIRTICDIAHFLGPSAPVAISMVDNSVFRAFEGLTCWRTRFDFSQCMHDL
jgi:hypothetical protein